MFKIILDKDHIPEKFYDTLGFPKYEVSGVVYDRNDGIEIDCMRQATVLPHWFQQHLMLARQKKIEDKTERRNKINKRQ